MSAGIDTNSECKQQRVMHPPFLRSDMLMPLGLETTSSQDSPSPDLENLALPACSVTLPDSHTAHAAWGRNGGEGNLVIYKETH